VDSTRFDALSRRLASRTTRRGVLAAAVALVAGRSVPAAACSLAGSACGPKRTDPACCAGSVCDARTRRCIGQAGAACATRTVCQTHLVCTGGVCAHPARLGAPCAATDACLAGLVCDSGVCRTPAGGKCSANSACVAGSVCRGGVCTGRGVHKQVCDEHADCAEHFTCVAKICRAQVGAPCAANAECPTGALCRTLAGGVKRCGKAGCSDLACGGGTCGPCPPGGICTLNSHCTSNSCVAGTCA
jgi:hypothetical protein